MKAPARFPDWSSLSHCDRAAAGRVCSSYLAHIGERLHAVARIFAVPSRRGGTLSGLPYVAKDMIATGQSDPSWGCAQAMVANAPPAPIIDRLNQSGASLVGTAEMTALAYEPSGMNAVRGAVLNPWNFDYAPGGSSSGSAALVAAGCCFAALGSDTGGSVRIPAHCCGVTALKPSWGKIPTGGVMPLAPNLDTVGLLARSAADIATIWAALFGEAIPGHPDALSGVVLTDGLADIDPETAKICNNAIAELGRLGMRIGTAAGFPEEADKNCLLVMRGEAARTHRTRLDDERVDPMLRKRLSKGLAISDQNLVAALARRSILRSKFLADLVGGADVALLPVMPIVTPRVAEVDPASPQFKARTLYALSRFTRFVNYLGLPALAVPVGFDDRGMPVGLQIIGRPGREDQLLAAGIILQAATDWHSRIPTAIAGDAAMEKGLVA